ncbi:NAD(P)H-dependent oxidoreductase [Paenibacillus sp. UMB7766-LJ446]|uniref:NADPH-dependent FMN reductase n=1 Tax=Paenibacillus sp. UMB7766-LJ446 TaxID=3046313 RepID=UPI0025510996|nr:NAD(P)H-dependent oxidoreductase [Paenibacillus sp. UMB7766-LJ446]MDK8191122.1 NAD(P)H-dependent oxidoreductase [Paenibacillus sp. UMB7766-LJ446]
MKLIGLSGSLIGSKTPVGVDTVLQFVKNNHPEIEVELIDLRDYKGIEFCDGRKLEDYNEDTQSVVQKLIDADFYVIGTPIYQSSLTGVLKNVFDLLPVQSIYNKVMGFIATGGTYQHYLVVENQLKPIAGFFRSYVAPSYVYLNSDHFDTQNNIKDTEALSRLEKLAEELVFMQTQLKVSSH